MDSNTLSNNAVIWDNCDFSYCEPRLKVLAHLMASDVLRHLAEELLHLKTSEYAIRCNPAGVAVSGEVTLHTDPLTPEGFSVYIQIGKSFGGGAAATVLWRTCNDRKDYSGHVNRWGTVTDLLGNEDTLHQFARNVIAAATPAAARKSALA